jgi:hypothetical protein
MQNAHNPKPKHNHYGSTQILHGYTNYYVLIWVNNTLRSSNFLQIFQTLDVF